MSRCAARVLAVATVVLLTLSLAAAAMAVPHDGAPGRPPAEARHKGGGFRFIRLTAEHLGVDPSVVMNELRQGKSLAEIAVAHGKTRESLKAALIADCEKHLERASQGQLKLTADEVRVLRGIAARAVDLALDRKWEGKR
ncbi:MAG: hypothetical protein ACM3XN_10900 [Chloroflexota bacterium]